MHSFSTQSYEQLHGILMISTLTIYIPLHGSSIQQLLRTWHVSITGHSWESMQVCSIIDMFMLRWYSLCAGLHTLLHNRSYCISLIRCCATVSSLFVSCSYCLRTDFIWRECLFCSELTIVWLLYLRVIKEIQYIKPQLQEKFSTLFTKL